MMNRYRVMNLPAPLPPVRRAVLGQVPAPALSADATLAAQSVAEARKALSNVAQAFPRLVQMLGEARARQAVEEARASLDGAQAAYDALAGGA